VISSAIGVATIWNPILKLVPWFLELTSSLIKLQYWDKCHLFPLKGDKHYSVI
jgi:hypothetical protein